MADDVVVVAVLLGQGLDVEQLVHALGQLRPNAVQALGEDGEGGGRVGVGQGVVGDREVSRHVADLVRAARGLAAVSRGGVRVRVRLTGSGTVAKTAASASSSSTTSSFTPTADRRPARRPSASCMLPNVSPYRSSNLFSASRTSSAVEVSVADARPDGEEGSHGLCSQGSCFVVCHGRPTRQWLAGRWRLLKRRGEGCCRSDKGGERVVVEEASAERVVVEEASAERVD